LSVQKGRKGVEDETNGDPSKGSKGEYTSANRKVALTTDGETREVSTH